MKTTNKYVITIILGFGGQVRIPFEGDTIMEERIRKMIADPNQPFIVLEIPGKDTLTISKAVCPIIGLGRESSIAQIQR